MARFTLAPVGIDDFRTSASVFPFTVELHTDAAAFWAKLNGPKSLSWCRLLRQVRWTSPPPHTVGSTRTATLALTGTTLEERYFHGKKPTDGTQTPFGYKRPTRPGYGGMGAMHDSCTRQTSSTESAWLESLALRRSNRANVACRGTKTAGPACRRTPAVPDYPRAVE